VALGRAAKANGGTAGYPPLGDPGVESHCPPGVFHPKSTGIGWVNSGWSSELEAKICSLDNSAFGPDSCGQEHGLRWRVGPEMAPTLRGRTRHRRIRMHWPDRRASRL